MSSTVYDWGSMPEPTEPVLPRAVALAWGVAANPQRGPKRELSIERIVDVAVELADAGGLAAVSMSSVATALGFTPMSLYRYVTAQGRPARADAGARDRRSAREHQRGRRRLARRACTPGRRRRCASTREHPWLLDIPIEGTPQTPEQPRLARLPRCRCSTVSRSTSRTRSRSCSRSWRRSAGRAPSSAATSRWRASGDRRPMRLDLAGSAMLEEFVTAGAVPVRLPGACRRASSRRSAAETRSRSGSSACSTASSVYLATAPSRPPAARIRARPLEAVAVRDQKYKEAVKSRREAEKALREARKRERERLRDAREKAREARDRAER